MNYEREINNAMEKAISALKSAEQLRDQYDKATEFTTEFLERCFKEGITKVSIGKKTKQIPESMSFPFGPSWSVFQFVPEKNKKCGESPPIWGIVNNMGISGGCGNSGQHQINSKGNESLIDGVYVLKKGRWMKMKDE